MFRRADQLLIEKVEDKFPLHVLDFYWDEFEPGLTCYDTKDYEVSEFDLQKVGFAVGKKRICVGYFDDDNHYIQCPKNSPVARFSQCSECSEESFLPFQDCVFEPRCDGEICDLDFCRREHVLYVAFYDTRMKIGMSSTRRVERRLIEQGADAFAILGKFATRKKAREAEKSISARLRLPQYIKQDTVLRGYSRPVDAKGIDGRYEALQMTLSEAYSLDVEPLRRLEGYPIELPLPHVPKLQEPWGSHKGELVGIKGKWMIYDAGGLKALNLSALEARYLSRDLP